MKVLGKITKDAYLHPLLSPYAVTRGGLSICDAFKSKFWAWVKNVSFEYCCNYVPLESHKTLFAVAA